MRRKQVGITSLTVGLVLVAWLLSPLNLTNLTTDHILVVLFVWVILVSLGVACICLVKRNWLGFSLSIPFFLAAAAYLFLLLVSMIGGGPFIVYEEIDSLELRHSRVVAYRTNGGATVDFGIAVVQEMPIVPGIMLTKHLHDQSDTSSATLDLTTDNSILVKIDDTTTEYIVHDFVYR